MVKKIENIFNVYNFKGMFRIIGSVEINVGDTVVALMVV